MTSDEVKARVDAELAKYKNYGHGSWRVGSCPDGERWAMGPHIHVSVGGSYSVFSLSIFRLRFVYDERGS